MGAAGVEMFNATFSGRIEWNHGDTRLRWNGLARIRNAHPYLLTEHRASAALSAAESTLFA